MKKQLVMSRGKRKCYIILRRLFVAAAVVIIVGLSCNSTITVETNGSVYQQSIGPFDKRGSFEDSTLFQEILQEEIRGITRMAVIKSQLETDGSYNGQKIIDIAQYAHRQEELPAETATAPFFLDDLVKWGNYGFVTETVCGTEDDLNSYFANGMSIFSELSELAAGDFRTQSASTKEIIKSLATEKNGETLSMRMIEELPSSLEEYQKRAEELGLYFGNAEVLELNILIPRYLSADGLDLAEYASSVQEYVQLREDLKTTSKELFYNSSEYWEIRNSHSLEETNIRYCYRMPVDGEICYFTNLEGKFAEKKLDEITRDFEEYGRHIYYNADRSEISTNTAMTAELMKQEMGYYQYAFRDNTRVWIAVDTSYPANDGLSLAKDAFNRLMPFYGYLVAAFIVFAAFAVLLFIRLTRFEGRAAVGEGGYRICLYKADRIPTEPFVVLGIALNAAIAGGGYLGYVFCITTWADAIHSIWLPLAAGGLALVLDYTFMAFYFSLVRRAKAHALWSNSCLRRLMVKAREAVLSLYDHSHILVRSLVPFIGIVLANLILGDMGIPGILAAALIDVAAILVLYLEKKALWEIVERTKRIGQGDFDLKIETGRLHGENRELAEAVNGIGSGIKTAVEQSMKDERLKADLITNVSHDIKTPLTSIINFVNLLKREKIEDPRIQGYIKVLDAKSQRLKQLTDDLVEASKITSGNISLQMERINFAELVNQTCGEFSDKFQEKCLEMVLGMPERPVYIEADSRRIWRVVENLFSNAYKYALEGTRVYLDIKETNVDGKRYAVFSMKNISAQALNIDASELTERFIRGDISRSTEGSGLGLSIAKNLTELQNGKFDIYLDGDLFKVLVTFPCLEPVETGKNQTE